MTALVSVLNKRGAAMAADSAMTVSGNGNTKIYNNEQKIFPLSNSNPIGVMICNNLSFLNTPLSLVFELYKSERGERKFSSLTGYVEDFVEYLQSLRSLQSNDLKNVFYQNEFIQLIRSFKSLVEENIQIQNKNSNLTEVEVTQNAYLMALNTWKEAVIDEEINPRLKNFSKEDYLKYIVEPNEEVFKSFQEDFPDMTEEYWNRIIEYCYRDLVNNTFGGYQGSEIIFVGYGENDIFPASQRLYLLGIVGDILKYNIEEISEISHHNSAEIRPFAQTDVMITLMKGVSPKSDSEYRDATVELEESIVNEIFSLLEKEKVSPEIIESVKNLDFDKIHERYNDRIAKFIHENFVSGVVDALECFNLEEMAKMAENLIAVTNLQRHISSSEESVGGPIEVASITKTGGFKWVKHYNLA